MSHDLKPDDAGSEAMGRAIDVNLFKHDRARAR
jgi:hypothetical protein